jgi:Acetyltransferase (GNAT) domain
VTGSALLLGSLAEGRRTRLERLQPRHLQPLFEALTAAGAADRWPLAGAAVPHDRFGEHLWAMGPIAFAVVRRDTSATVGLVQAVDPDLRSGTTDVGVAIVPEMWRAGWPLEGVVLFVDYLIRGVGFRKLYFSMPGGLAAQRGHLLRRWLTLECTLRDQIAVGDGYDDLVIFGLHRDSWDESLLDRLDPRGRVEPGGS